MTFFSAFKFRLSVKFCPAGETGINPKECTKCSCEHEEEKEVPCRGVEKQKKKKANLQTALKV